MRLINVAVTRARGKLVMLAHLDWLRRTVGRDAGLLGDILFGAERCEVVPPLSVGPPEPGARPPYEGEVESPIERLLVDQLVSRRAVLPAFVLQHRIYNEERRIVSRADIAFVEEKVAIYCDGAVHHLKKDQWQRDQRQRRELMRLGWLPLTFTGSELTSNSSRAGDEIVRVLSSRTAKTPASASATGSEPASASPAPRTDQQLNSRQRHDRLRAIWQRSRQAATSREGPGATTSGEAAGRFVSARVERNRARREDRAHMAPVAA